MLANLPRNSWIGCCIFALAGVWFLVSCTNDPVADSPRELASEESIPVVSTAREPEVDAAAPERHAEDILKAVMQAYGNCQSYFEKGDVIVRTSDGFTSFREYSVAFSRDRGFRFEHGIGALERHRGLIQIDHDMLRLFFAGMAGEYELDNEGHVVASALRGVRAHMDDAVWFVHHLLLEDPQDNDAFAFQNLERLADGASDGVPSFRLRGVILEPRKRDCVLYVDKGTFAIREIVQEFEDMDGRLTVRIRGRPAFNVPEERLSLGFDVPPEYWRQGD